MSFYETVIYDGTQDSVEFAKTIRENLKVKKMVYVKNESSNKSDEDLRKLYNDLSETVGECVALSETYVTGEKTGEKWMEIRYDHDVPDDVAYRHSKNAQPMHTDGSYLSNYPKIMLMYCVNRAPKGGETTFIDSDDLVKILREENEALYQRLISTPVRFSKADDYKVRKIIDTDENGLILNWNYHCIDPNESDEHKQLGEEFHAFLQSKVVGTDNAIPFPIDPGDGVYWHDERTLHGRNSFEANKTNDRFLWKAGIKVDFI